jgi:putative PIN family toxin of toxin-antitoxin system
MGETPEALRVVLDTNTVLSALLFEHGQLTRIRKIWENHRIRPLCSDATVDELLRVLAYPKFELIEPEILALLQSYLRYAHVVTVSKAATDRAPKCRDPDDQKFLDLAFAGAAEALVTGDSDLKAHADEVPFAIESPALFIRRFE